MNSAKKKRVRIIIGVIGGFFVFCIVASIIEGGKREERFTANKEQIVGDLREALDGEELSKCEVIVSEYRYVDDHDMKLLVAEYDAILKAKKEELAALKETKKKLEAAAQEQARVDAQTCKLGEPVRGDILEVVVKKAHVTKNVGSWLWNESAQQGVKYLAVDYSYKNISKSPTHESPTLTVISPDGAEYSADVSASAAYASNSDDYSEEVFSELNPQVHNNGVEVFKVPQSIEGQTGWRLRISFEEGFFSGGRTSYLTLN